MNLTAIEILNAQRGNHQHYVFVKNGKPLGGISSKVWKKALAKADISNFRWHDLRHIWASWLVQSGVPLMELKEMGGWESIEMVQRYAHLAPEHLHKNASLIDKVQVTNTSHEKEAFIRLLAG